MSLHDDYARMTPFELAFPDREGIQALSDALADQGADTDSPEVFVSSPVVASFVRQLAPSDASQAALHHLGMLTFHGVHFLRAGSPLYLLDASVARELVARAPDASPQPPHPAGYLQLPQHLFWVSGPGGDAPESLDGISWTASESGDLHVLTISGVRPDRPGFAALVLPVAPLDDASLWMNRRVRESEEDFVSSLPGGDLDRLCLVERAGELLKLIARFFAYAAARPDALKKAEPLPREASAPAPSELPYTLVRSAA